MQPSFTLKFNDRRGVWEVRWSERTPSGGWRSRAISTGEAQKRPAEAFLREFQRVERERETHGGTTPIRDLVDAYVKAVPGQRWNLHQIKTHLGDHTPTQLSHQDFLVLETHVPNPGTRRRYLGALRAALNWAADHGLCEETHLPEFDLPPPNSPRELFLDEVEEADFYGRAMWDSVQRKTLSRVTRFVALALDTGARRGAIEGLTWDRVDLDKGRIDYREPGRPVTRKRRGVVPISERLGPVLERAARERTSKLSPVVGQGAIKKAYETWVRETPYSWATPHVLRHTFATLLIRAGVDVTEVAELLADDPATVMRVYRHHRPDWLRQAVNGRWW